MNIDLKLNEYFCDLVLYYIKLLINFMKYLFYYLIFICFLSCKTSNEILEEEANCIGDYSTENILTNINEEIFNNDESGRESPSKSQNSNSAPAIGNCN